MVRKKNKCLEKKEFDLKFFFCWCLVENHRLQTVFENNLTAKLFIFYFVNSFVGLFYEAFFNASYGTVAQVKQIS